MYIFFIICTKSIKPIAIKERSRLDKLLIVFALAALSIS